MLSGALGLAGLSLTAGCSSVRDRLWSQTGATDVFVISTASQPRTLTVAIRDTEADAQLTERTIPVSPGEQAGPVRESKLPTNTSYRIEASLEDGPSETFEWTDPTVERAPLWILVDDSQNIKFLLQAG